VAKSLMLVHNEPTPWSNKLMQRSLPQNSFELKLTGVNKAVRMMKRLHIVDGLSLITIQLSSDIVVPSKAIMALLIFVHQKGLLS
jgi:hypothetical protein